MNLFNRSIQIAEGFSELFILFLSEIQILECLTNLLILIKYHNLETNPFLGIYWNF